MTCLFFTLTLILYLISSVRADLVLGQTVPGNVSVITTAQDAFDGPRISAVNSTSFEWWFFDAVTQDGLNSLAIVFYRMNESELSSPVFLQATIVFTNGTIFDISFPVNASSVTVDGLGASGIWGDVGYFKGAKDLSSYEFTLTTKEIQGTFKLKATAPAHYPDGNHPLTKGASPFVAPGLGWFNAIPAGKGTANLTILGEAFAFKNMVGYHDHNFGGSSLAQGDKSWYFGHATIGPYKLVWYDVISAFTGQRTSSVYLVENNQILIANNNTAFASESMFGMVLPFGNGSQFPPPTSRMPSSFILTYVGKDDRQWSFVARGRVATDTSMGMPAGYTRWTGKVTGGEVGGCKHTGSGVWEWLRFFDSQPVDTTGVPGPGTGTY